MPAHYDDPPLPPDAGGTDPSPRACDLCGATDADAAFIDRCDVCGRRYCDDCSPHRTDDAPIDLCVDCCRPAVAGDRYAELGGEAGSA